MNNGKYHTESYKKGQAAKYDRMFGPIETHIKKCENCQKEFEYVGRMKTKSFNKPMYCSISCSNNRTKWWSSNSKNYRTIARQNNEKFKCVVCGFDKIVAIHHIDENKKNNDPSNLIPLCPNHHEMCHSKYKSEIKPYIDEWQKTFWGVGEVESR